ncbi:hypothetical protein [Haloarchaeobius amylolyticus]|uniref:hypothetical protein n=1 Tax=Haloarchaeobius amylolyticus TaxID=1198296 RepID=UPI00226DD1C1|nr:hypothetical protein [Haloarchaeobius amylolyticus]
MSQELRREWFESHSRVNAGVAWVLTALLVLATLSSLLRFRVVDVVLGLSAVLIAVAPALVSRSWTTTVPWPLLLLAVVPLLGGAFETTAFVGMVVTGVGIAGLGMLLVATLQLVTTVRMTAAVAVAFTVLTTLAFAGYWAVGSALSATYLGTGFVATNTELMQVFTAALLGGVVGGLVFRWYFRRQLGLPAPGATPAEGEVA